jgi:protein phosphatase
MTQAKDGENVLIERLIPIEHDSVLSDRYRIVKFLECKSGANIYRAIDTVTNLTVIIKERPAEPVPVSALEPGEWSDTVLDNAFQNEFLILRSVSYPTVVKALDIFRQADRAYLVIEQLEGQDLAYFLTQNTVSVQMSLEWMIQLCQSISQLHRRRILHLDIQPRYLVVAPDRQRIRLTGFHRAAVLPVVPRSKMEKTPGYSSTEMHGLFVDPIDQRSDIYSLGIVWFQLLTGQNPETIVNDPDWCFLLPSVAEFLPGIHPQIARIVARMVDPDPQNRYQTITDVKNDLLELINHPRRAVFSFSDVGMLRETNEDAVAIREMSVTQLSHTRGLGFYLVADGMGGVNAGEVASALAVEETLSVLDERLRSDWLETVLDPGVIIQESLHIAITRANSRIYESSAEAEHLSGMGTTLTAAVVYGQNLYVGHVGDSRCYVINQGTIEKITRDHSLVSRLVEIGQITEDDALIHPQRNLIYRALGTYANVEVDMYQRALKLGDWVLLCSDGLTTYLRDEEIQRVVLQYEEPSLAAQHLVNFANTRGGEDNISVVLINLARHQ